MTDDFILCEQCGKKIQFERPHFCPFCGAKVDPTQGLVDEASAEPVYRWAGVAPALVNLFVGWLFLVVPVTLVWGRNGFAILGAIFGAILLTTFYWKVTRR